MADTPMHKSDSGRTTPKPEGRHSLTYEQSIGIAQENARLAGIEAKLIGIPHDKRTMPLALEDQEWEGYAATLIAFKATRQDTDEYRDIKAALEYYENKINEEHIRIERIDAKLAEIRRDRETMPSALEDQEWEDYAATLTALKTTVPDINVQGYIEATLNYYENKINNAKAEEESARLERIDAKLAEIRRGRETMPSALEDQEWEDYAATLTALRTTVPDINVQGYIEATLNYYHSSICLYEVLSEKKGEYNELCSVIYSPSNRMVASHDGKTVGERLDEFLTTIDTEYKFAEYFLDENELPPTIDAKDKFAKILGKKQEIYDKFIGRIKQMKYDLSLIKKAEDKQMGVGYSQFKIEWIKSHNWNLDGIEDAWKTKQEEEEFDFTRFLNEP